jgi:hypothetical protein
MLLRISLILAIIAGLAVATVNIVVVKDKVEKLGKDRDNEKSLKDTANRELTKTKADLKKTSEDLASTKTLLESTTAERDKAQTDLEAQTKRANKLTDDLAKRTQERNDAQAELARYVVTGYTPERIIAMGNELKDLQKKFEGSLDENKLLAQNVMKLKNRLRRYEEEHPVVELPPDLKGKILVTDPKWNFVVMNVGQDQGVLEYGEMLVNRNGKLVAKVIVRTVQKDRSIANVLPGWQLGDIVEGDQVIPAHPAS